MRLEKIASAFKRLFAIVIIGSGLIVAIELAFDFQITSKLLYFIRPTFSFMTLESVKLDSGFYPSIERGKRDDILVAALGYKGQPIYVESYLFISSIKKGVSSQSLEKYLYSQRPFEEFKVNNGLQRCFRIHDSHFQILCPVKNRPAIVFYKGKADDFPHFHGQLIKLLLQLQKLEEEQN